MFAALTNIVHLIRQVGTTVGHSILGPTDSLIISTGGLRVVPNPGRGLLVSPFKQVVSSAPIMSDSSLARIFFRLQSLR